MQRHLTRGRQLLRAATVATAAVAMVGCSSTKKNPSIASNATVATAAPATAAPATAAPATAAPSTAQAPSGGGVSGTWNGTYSGTLNGTFVLTWQQSGQQLTGSIHVSPPASTLAISGTVQGSQIQFGSVSGGVSYTGTVSGGSMSGKWQLGPTASRGGNWSASKA